jgi:Protein of unknown function (DUF1566)
MNPRKRKALQGLAGVLFAGLLLHAGGAAAEGRFVISPEGTRVSDSLTGLTWRRCSEGQIYGDGTCNGNASTFTHEAALAHAKTQTGWRLPNIKELSSIVDTSRFEPAIDPVAFPATSTWPYWSSSPYVVDPGLVWYVEFNSGGVWYLNGYRSQSLNVRLVR